MPAASMYWSIILSHPIPARIWIFQYRSSGLSGHSKFEPAKRIYGKSGCSKNMFVCGGGSTINIFSVGGIVLPDISQVAYGTSKAEINYLTRLIAVHEAKNQIRCNAVLPGATATEAVEKHLTETFRSLFLRHIPLGRMGLPEEIAQAVVYFASDESAYTTGQILTVSGGFGLATPVCGDLAGRTSRR